MNQLISDLLARYARVIEHEAAAGEEIVDNYNSLRLADAALDKVKLNQSQPDHPTQIVIIGPTQAGKSTLCNFLLDGNSAGVSALAGFTVHAQGFASHVSDESLTHLSALLHPLQRVPSEELNPELLNQYALENANCGSQAAVKNAVVWDSPDFDSIESDGYRSSVLQVMAIADVLVLMVSKDKYADKTVWDTLQLLKSLDKPLVVCVNKLDEHDEDTVLKSFEARYQDHFNDTCPTIIPLPFVKRSAKTNDDVADERVEFPSNTAEAIRAELKSAIAKINRRSQQASTHHFIETNWPKWVRPIQTELDAHQQWREAVDEVVTLAKERYATRYLHNPSKYDSFNKAIAELLTLLEIPGMAKALATTRNVVTWPARKLLGLGRQLSSRGDDVPDQEMEVLDLIHEQSVTSLQGQIMLERQESDDNALFWSSMNTALLNNRKGLKQDYAAKAEALRVEFEPKIDETAQRLYSQLQEQPALLNTLRAARVSTDAAAVVLAVKSGGLAAADLVIAPAMLSVTTLLTESALGQYMDRSKKQLIDEQRVLVEEQLMENELGATLKALATTLDDPGLLSFDYDSLPDLATPDFSLNNSVN